MQTQAHSKRLMLQWQMPLPAHLLLPVMQRLSFPSLLRAVQILPRLLYLTAQGFRAHVRSAHPQQLDKTACLLRLLVAKQSLSAQSKCPCQQLKVQTMHLVVLLVGQELRAYSRAMQPQQAVAVGLLCLLVAIQGLRAHGRSLQALQQQPTRQQPT